MKHLILLLAFPIALFGQSSDTRDSSNGKKPDLTKISFADVKWAKAEGGSFWFYYKPTQYFFQTKEFQTITLETGDVIVYMYEIGIYLSLPEFPKAVNNGEHGVELASSRSCIFVKRSRGMGFWIYDKGQYVDNLERIGMNTLHQYVYKCSRTDKRYWIEESDFVFAPLGKPVGILSE